MSELTTPPERSDSRPPLTDEQISPEDLLTDFKSKPLAKIVLFTIVIHAIFIGVFSIGYLSDAVLGESPDEVSEDARMANAVDESTKAIRDIAEKYNLNVKQLTARFAGDAKPEPSGDTSTQITVPPPGDADDGGDPDDADDPPANVPVVPPLGGGLDAEDEIDDFPAVE